MQLITSNYGILERLARLKNALSGESEEFTCRDCERWESCSLPPSETCVVRAAQLERGDWKRRRWARTWAIM
jgi:hypothetical protein